MFMGKLICVEWPLTKLSELFNFICGGLGAKFVWEEKDKNTFELIVNKCVGSTNAAYNIFDDYP